MCAYLGEKNVVGRGKIKCKDSEERVCLACGWSEVNKVRGLIEMVRSHFIGHGELLALLF